MPVQKIYAVTWCDWDEYNVEAIFTDPDEAEKYRKLNSTRKRCLGVDEYPLADTVEEMDDFHRDPPKWYTG